MYISRKQQQEKKHFDKGNNCKLLCIFNQIIYFKYLSIVHFLLIKCFMSMISRLKSLSSQLLQTNKPLIVRPLSRSIKCASKKCQPGFEPIISLSKFILLFCLGELYHEQYNEHGVMIEKNLSDHDLIQKYLG